MQYVIGAALVLGMLYGVVRLIAMADPQTLARIGRYVIAFGLIGIGGLLFRTIHLFFIKDVMTGLVWMFKIATDPFHDFMLYRKSPLALLKGELIDPMDHVNALGDEITSEQGTEAKTLP